MIGKTLKQTPRRNRRKWAQADVDKIIEAVRASGRPPQVADTFGLTTAQVWGLIRGHAPDLDVPAIRRQRDAELDDEVVRYACEKLGVGKGKRVTLNQIVKASGIYTKRVKESLERQNIKLPAKQRVTGVKVGQRFDLWEVLSDELLYKGPDGYTPKSNNSGGRLKCLCHGCGKEDYPQKRNLIEGASKGCRDCRALMTKGTCRVTGIPPKPVKGKTTGRKFASQTAAAEALGLSRANFRRKALRGDLIDGEQWEIA